MRPSTFVLPAIVLPAVLFAQTQDLPVFRAGTTLVEFTLVALDAEGRPVTDLTKEEIVIRDGDRTRDVAFLRFDGETAAVISARPPLPPGHASNRPIPDRNAVAIVLDMLNVPVHYQDKYGQTEMRSLILQTLNALPPNTYAGLFRFAETQPIVALAPFTTNVEMLRNQVRNLQLALRLEHSTASVSLSGASSKADGGASLRAMAESESRANNGRNTVIYELRLSRSLAALQSLGNHLGGIAGRKSLVWITVPPPIRFGNVNYEPRIREAAQRLASRGIALYPVYASGLPPERRDDKDEISTFSVLADVTGGRLTTNTNDLLSGLSLAANDQRGTYVLGYYVEDEARDRWNPVSVTVNRKGINIRHREGYVAVRHAKPSIWQASDWNALAAQPLDSTELWLNGRADAAANLQVLLSLQVASRDLYFHGESEKLSADLEIALIELSNRGPTNVRVQPMEVSVPSDATARPEFIAMKVPWPLGASTIAVRAVVRDRITGKYGTLQLALNRTTP